MNSQFMTKLKQHTFIECAIDEHTFSFKIV